MWLILKRNPLGNTLPKPLLDFHPWMAELREDRNRQTQTRCSWQDVLGADVHWNPLRVPIVAATFLHRGRSIIWDPPPLAAACACTPAGVCSGGWKCAFLSVNSALRIHATSCIPQFLLSPTTVDRLNTNVLIVLLEDRKIRVVKSI